MTLTEILNLLMLVIAFLLSLAFYYLRYLQRLKAPNHSSWTFRLMSLEARKHIRKIFAKYVKIEIFFIKKFAFDRVYS